MASEGMQMAEQPPAGEITRLLAEWTEGRRERAPELWSMVYRELRQIAGAYMRNERPDHTLQTTALVNEAYVRIFQGKPFRWENRKHFLCTMAQMMRRILVDHARENRAQKRGGECEKLARPAPERSHPLGRHTLSNACLAKYSSLKLYF